MADKLDIILEKLGSIENRLEKVEDKKPVTSTPKEKEDKHGQVTVPLILQTLKLIQGMDEISTDILEEKLHVDYNVAAKILEILENEGFVADM